MTFEEWLDSKEIPYTKVEDGKLMVGEDFLREHEQEIRNLFPETIFGWEIQPNHIYKDN